MIKNICTGLIIGFISLPKADQVPTSVQKVLQDDSLGSRSLSFEEWVKLNSVGYDSSEYEYIWSNEIYIYRKRKFEYQQCDEFMCGLIKENVYSFKKKYIGAKYYKIMIFHNIIGSSWVVNGKVEKILWKPAPELEKDTTEIIAIERDGKFLGSMPVQVGWACISESEIKK